MTSTAPLRDPANRVSPKAVRLWLLESLIAFVFFAGGSILVARWVGAVSYTPLTLPTTPILSILA
ncbi:hypothetical protein [Nonomuraea zeae]|uniref:Uncharacterized protein n=1 Tax=Nonomuraea zeae TaxID=1642303 RepID=A0A5S4EZG9_9ACTN|nr:hypothetical protein [Nonomuraea zeae]TMR09081.1 hypothetical protein ETD85_61755 [Nonomuraea zeae]